MIVLKKEHDSGCNRFSSHLSFEVTCHMGEGLLTNDRRERRGGGLQRLIICCEPSSPWPVEPLLQKNLFFNMPACLSLSLGFEAINQK